MKEVAAAKEAADEAATFDPVMWTPSAPWPAQPFTIGLLDGKPHRGDVGWFVEQCDPNILHLRIDKAFGGYNHHIGLARTIEGLLKLMRSPHYVGMAASVNCTPWTALHFEGEQTVMFNSDHPGGIPNADGSMPVKTQVIIDEANAVVKLMDCTLSLGKRLISELPAGQGAGELNARVGAEKHVTIACVSFHRT